MLLSRILRLRLDYSVSPILFVCSLQLSPELHVASFRTSSEAPQDWLVYNSALSLPPSSQILMGSAIEKNTSSIVNRSTNGDDKEDLSKRKTRKLQRLPPLHDVRNSSMKTVMRCASKRKDLIAPFQDESSPVKVALCAIITNSCGGPQQSRSRLRTVVTVLANRTLSKLYMHSSTATKSVYPRIVLIRGELLKVTFPAVQSANWS